MRCLNLRSSIRARKIARIENGLGLVHAPLADAVGNELRSCCYYSRRASREGCTHPSSAVKPPCLIRAARHESTEGRVERREIVIQQHIPTRGIVTGKIKGHVRRDLGIADAQQKKPEQPEKFSHTLTDERGRSCRSRIHPGCEGGSGKFGGHAETKLLTRQAALPGGCDQLVRNRTLEVGRLEYCNR